MADEDSSFDPRFDPRFQPGYDPEKHTDHRLEQRRADDGTSRRDAVGRSRSSAASVPVIDAEELAPGGELDRPEREDEDAAPRRLGTMALLVRNPFLWAIVIIGAALVGWGWTSYAAALDSTQSFMFGLDPENEETMREYTATQFALGIAPLAVVVGLLALIGAVFFAAVTWFRARRP